MKVGVIADNELNHDSRVLREIRILISGGHQVFVLCFAYSGKSYPEIDNVSVTRIRINKTLKNFLFASLNTLPFYENLWSRRIRKFILQNNLQTLHVHDLYMSRSAYSGISKSGAKIKMILDLHENYPEAVLSYNWTKGFLRSVIVQPAKWEKKEAEYLKFPDAIISLSEELIELLKLKYTFLSEKEMAAIPNVPDETEIGEVKKPTIEIKLESPLLLYFGAVAERRGIFTVLDALNSIANTGEITNFLIIGPIDKKDRSRFFSTINTPALRDRIQYNSWINLQDLNSVMSVCDAGLAPFIKNPQHESGVANKIYQYMAGSLPVIASDCKPQREIIEKFGCGKIFRDLNELISLLKWVKDNPIICKEMGRNGYNAIQSHYNIENYKDKLLSLYS